MMTAVTSTAAHAALIMFAPFRTVIAACSAALFLAACSNGDGVATVPPGTPPGDVAVLTIAPTASDRFVSVADGKGREVAQGGAGSANERKVTLMPGKYQVVLKNAQGNQQAASQITVQRGQTFVFSMSAVDEANPEVVYALASADGISK